MKKKKNLFEYSENDIIFNYEKTEAHPFSERETLVFSNERFFYPDKLNVIAVSPSVYERHCHEKYVLTKKGGNGYINVTLVKKDSLENNCFYATSIIKDELSLKDGDEVELCRYTSCSFENIITQKIDHIRESELIISKKDTHGNLIPIDDYKYFELYNPFTYDSIIIKREHIVVDETLTKDGTIRLNRKQRFCLGCELPQILTAEQWNTLEANKEEIALISEVYDGEDHILNKNASYKQKSEAKKIIANHFASKMMLIPVLRSAGQKKKSFGRRLTDFYVGKSTISLICRRPYDNDEGLDIIRMSPSNMSLLGIDEMDKVILQYKDRKISTRVLSLEDDDAFLETNLPISTDLVVGVPVHIRKKLGVMDLSTTIKVDRDTAFIFKKSINEQIVPILLTLFSTNLFTDFSVVLSAGLSLLAIPIVLYFNLSSKRNMRA